MGLKTMLAVFWVLVIFVLTCLYVTENMVMIAHATVSVCTTVPGSACITTGKNPQECRATFPPCHSVTNRQAALDRRSEIIACELNFKSEGCKIVVKN
jgi:hypothetical protein